ncbi:MAG: hypothetical protein IJO40_15060 [Thermoguttaceae bacterium]|nr:hypothetical protein [Thermoguttaceae bacterium]
MSPTSASFSASTSPTSADSRRRFVSFPVAARFAFFLFFLWFWGVRYGDFLYVAQGYDMFLWRWSFLTDAIRPAELSLRLSAFFVQFFYYPALGAAILAGFLALIQFGTERLFRLTGRLFRCRSSRRRSFRFKLRTSNITFSNISTSRFCLVSFSNIRSFCFSR